MNSKKVVTILLVLFVLASGIFMAFGGNFGSNGQDAEQGAGYTARSDSPEEGHRVVAYYFHTTTRCPTCIKIESYTKESIETNFASQIEAGVLELRVVNVDDEENEHFIQDYSLTTKSVVLSNFVDGEQVAWKNLDRVWDYTGDKEVFVDYIRDETSEYLAELIE